MITMRRFIVFLSLCLASANALALKEKPVTSSGLTLHKRNMVLPFTASSLSSGRDGYEVVFQISGKQQLFNRRVFIGYTQKAFWQILDDERSRPFRESNYNPEIFYRGKTRDLWSGHFDWDFGYEHESNGQTTDRSRSWDRLYGVARWQQDSFEISLKSWWRLPEDEKTDPSSPEGDDNPDIHDHWGRAELRSSYLSENGHGVHGMVRGNPRVGHGAFELQYTVPAPSEGIHFILHAFSGYGDSLFDYNRYVNRIGIGLSFQP